MNGSSAKAFRVAVDADDLDSKEIQLKEQLAKIEEERLERQAELKANELRKIEEAKAKKASLLADADHFETLSLKAFSSDDKKSYADFAMEARKSARAIVIPGEAEGLHSARLDSESEAEKAGWIERALSHRAAMFVALFIFAGVAILSRHMVFEIGDEINAINLAAAKSQDLSQMVPPSIGQMTFQKGWFNWMTISIDLAALMIILALIAPDKLFFLLPFTSKIIQAWKPFSEQSESQKQWQSFAYVALILLFLALSHLGAK
jgi:hypothetical protein